MKKRGPVMQSLCVSYAHTDVLVTDPPKQNKSFSNVYNMAVLYRMKPKNLQNQHNPPTTTKPKTHTHTFTVGHNV